MSNKFQPAPGWAPPGAQFSSRGTFSRTMIGAIVGLVVTPVGIGLAAHGAMLSSHWWATADRWGAPAQSAAGALLLLLVAVLAAYSPAGTMIAGLVWGVLPGVIEILFPNDTFRLVGTVAPWMSNEMHNAVQNWLASGVVLIIGTVLFGAGVAATFRRK